MLRYILPFHKSIPISYLFWCLCSLFTLIFSLRGTLPHPKSMTSSGGSTHGFTSFDRHSQIGLSPAPDIVTFLCSRFGLSGPPCIPRFCSPFLLFTLPSLESASNSSIIATDSPLPLSPSLLGFRHPGPTFEALSLIFLSLPSPLDPDESSHHSDHSHSQPRLFSIFFDKP